VGPNSAKRGRRAVALRGSDRLYDGEALYCRIQQRLLNIFGPPDEDPKPDVDPKRQVGRLGNWFGVLQRALRRRARYKQSGNVL
jgi:hypothetical protein